MEWCVVARVPEDFVLFWPVRLMQCEVDLGAMCMAYSLVDVLTLKMAVILFH